jgi:hypothetical protein
MQAYSQDLRERVLRALDRGDRPTEIGALLNTIHPTECTNYFASSGYVCI